MSWRQVPQDMEASQADMLVIIGALCIGQGVQPLKPNNFSRPLNPLKKGYSYNRYHICVLQEYQPRSCPKNVLR
jgi:hypothetical protein